MNEIIKEMKLRKFQVEIILGHLQGGNYEFKKKNIFQIPTQNMT